MLTDLPSSRQRQAETFAFFTQQPGIGKFGSFPSVRQRGKGRTRKYIMTTHTTTIAIASAAAAAAACFYMLRRRRLLRNELAVAAPLKICEAAAAPSTPAPAAAKALLPDEAETAAAARVHAVGPTSPLNSPDFESAANANADAEAPLSTKPAEPPLAATANQAAEEIERYHASRRELNDRNRAVTREWERREWNKAKAKLDAAEARTKALEAAGVETLQQRSARILSEMRAAQAQAEAEAAERPESAALTEAASNASAAASEPSLPKPPPGATAESIAAELDRWPKPPPTAAGAEASPLALLPAQPWPLYYDHFDWLDEVASRYAFADAGEVLRHLVFCANGEPPAVKKLIFLIIRCLHCHSGARAGHIPKKSKALSVFAFQHQWLQAVQQRSKHPTVEKTVRIICDYCAPRLAHTSPPPHLVCAPGSLRCC